VPEPDPSTSLGASPTTALGTSHDTSLAVWNLSVPVVIGRRATLKVGLSCTSGCNLSGTPVDIYNDAGERIGTGTLGSEPWPATAALHWAELDLAAPDREGDLSLDIHVTPKLPHTDATSVVTVAVSRPPEHRVTLHVIDKASGAPLAGVELRLGRFRTATNDEGSAQVEIPGGSYDVGTWKNGYEVLSTTVDITRDATIHLELAAVPEPEQPYWM
jgi:hypothetical protein